MFKAQMAARISGLTNFPNNVMHSDLEKAVKIL